VPRELRRRWQPWRACAYGIASAHVRIQHALADAQALRCDLEQFIIVEVFDTLIQAHLARRGEPEDCLQSAWRMLYDGRVLSYTFQPVVCSGSKP